MVTDLHCEFCSIIANREPAREVLRNEHVVAFLPLKPATLGHTLVVPREHIPNAWALDSQVAHHLTDATLVVARAVRDAFTIKGLNIIQSNGEVATQSVMHVHVHVVPRYIDDGMGLIWPDDTDCSEATKADVQRKIRVGVDTALRGESDT